jgi:poly(hydroxyalkanoate) granule-associated protein
MAKLKKNVRAKSAAGKPSPDLQAKAEQMSRSIVDSAQQIWMAGIGAFNRAQGEGSKLFEALVKEGMSIETTTRRLATGRVDAVRDAVEDRVGVVRERAVDTWDRLEKVFEDRVQRALNRLGVPAREDLAELTARVNELNAELRRLSGGARPATKTVAARKAPAVKKPATKRGKTLPKTARPVAPQSR